jgi:hypothetical protein
LSSDISLFISSSESFELCSSSTLRRKDDMTTTWVEVRHFLFVLYLLHKLDLNLKDTERKNKLKLRHFMTPVFPLGQTRIFQFFTFCQQIYGDFRGGREGL